MRGCHQTSHVRKTGTIHLKQLFGIFFITQERSMEMF